MTDRYEKIRQALAMGATPGSWVQDIDGDAAYAMFCCQTAAEAAFIVACDPDTIRELLAERDQLAGALTAQAQEIAELREKAERLWIDAKERLPQEGQRVVCEYKTGEVWAGRYRKAIRCERWMPIDRAIEGAKP